MEDSLKFCKIRNVKTPTRGTPFAAGIDFYIPNDITPELFADKCKLINSDIQYITNENNHITDFIIKAGQSILIPSGIKMKIPNDYALIFMNKSSIGAKKQLCVCAAVVDCDYEGEVHINLVNTGLNTQIIRANDKIVQGVLLQMNYCIPEEVENEEILFKDSNSIRKEGGFGSTGN